MIADDDVIVLSDNDEDSQPPPRATCAAVDGPPIDPAILFSNTDAESGLIGGSSEEQNNLSSTCHYRPASNSSQSVLQSRQMNQVRKIYPLLVLVHSINFSKMASERW
ncbi:hypothetical protein AB6A40_000135 [Gnathostoma spinigerum]|uniref:Uncharacterized protein n=1 Tax=Gnathostoma spinigerum TaxID=75299 RepID=A0ABD6E3G5_9BILA